MEGYQNKTIFVEADRIKENIKAGLKKDATEAEMVIAALLATGARPIEIANSDVSQFEVISEKEVKQIGVAKGRTENWNEYRKKEIKKTC